MVKKKSQPSSSGDQIEGGEDVANVEMDDEEKRRPVFRNANFHHQITAGGKKKTWKSLKQILAQERSLLWPQDTPLYSNIGAPPLLKPPKKYSDISGLEAKYTDPQTKLHFSSSEEFSTIRSLPSDIISGYLNLRGAINPIA